VIQFDWWITFTTAYLFILLIKIYVIVTFIAARQITTMTGCSVEGCKNRSEDGIIFKSIPKNPYKRSIWTKHMNRTPPKNGRICADHFSEDQWEIYGKVLKKHAAPSIFGFPKFSLNSNIEENMCAALPDNLNQFKENFNHVHLQKKIQNLKKRLMIFKVNNKKLSNALYLQKRQNRELKEKLENVFTDQLQVIRTKKFRKCSNETLTKSLKLKFACGTSGYTMLRKMKLPFPAIRTLNYHLQNLQFKSGVLDDVINFMKIKIETFASLTTAFFINMVSTWFKLISSRTTTLALNKFNLRVYQETLLFLDEFITLFSSLQVAPDKNGKSLWKPIQTGVILTTKSILDLQNLFLNEKKYSFLLTSRFSQDCLENVFSQIRSHADSNSIQTGFEIVVCFSIFRHAI
jgi:hypothetical protein